MICKKCGANVEENSKFCGYCGNVIEKTNELPNVVNESLNNELNTEQVFSNVNLGEQFVFEPVYSSSENVQSVVEPVQPSSENVQSVVEPVQTNLTNDSEIKIDANAMETIVGSDTNNNELAVNVQEPVASDPANNQVPVNEQVETEQIKQKSGKKNKTPFIIGMVLLIIAIGGILVYTFLNSNNSHVTVLEKALNNLAGNNASSITLDADLLFSGSTGESLSFVLTVEGEKKDDNKMDMKLTLNKTMFFEEINAYLSVDKTDANMYLPSNLIDMLGMTSSLTPVWVYYTASLDELTSGETSKNQNSGVYLKDFIDKKHFVFKEQSGSLKHYVLIIDQELVDKMKEKLVNVDDETAKQTLESMQPIEKPINIDFYITETDELSKIEIDISNYLEDNTEISEFKISMSFRNLNSTKVEIPSEVLNSTTDLQTYMMENPVNYNVPMDGYPEFSY